MVDEENETFEEFVLRLNWNTQEKLKEAKDFLNWADNRDKDWLKKQSKLEKRADKASREWLVKCIEFWENRLKNENKST